MSESYSLPTAPEGMAAALLERFNSGKVGEMMPLYEPEAVLIANDGRPVTGHAGIAAELARDVVETDRNRLADLAQRLRHGRLKPIAGPCGHCRKRPPRSPPAGVAASAAPILT